MVLDHLDPSWAAAAVPVSVGSQARGHREPDHGLDAAPTGCHKWPRNRSILLFNVAQLRCFRRTPGAERRSTTTLVQAASTRELLTSEPPERPQRSLDVEARARAQPNEAPELGCE